MNRCLQVLAILCLTATLSAQSGIRFEELYSINSLSQNSVVSIHQDRMGFLWIGTFDGLNKYDGYGFRTYKLTEDSLSRSSINRVMSIREDRNGNIWIQTYDDRMHRFNPAREKFLSFPPAGDTGSAAFIKNYFESEDGFVCLSSDRLGAYFIFQDSVTGTTKTFHLYNDPRSGRKRLSDNSTAFILQGGRQNFWIGTASGINRIALPELRNPEGESEMFFHEGVAPGSAGISFLNGARLVDRIWFGTEKEGLLCYDEAIQDFINLDRYENYREFAQSRITTLETSGGDLWAGTRKGTLLRYDSESDDFRIYPLSHPLTGKTIKSIYIDHFGQVWLLTDRFGITRLDPASGRSWYYHLTIPEEENLTDDERTVIFEDSRKQLWLGGQNLGVLHYLRGEDRFETYKNDPKDPTSLPSNIVECITEDREGNLLIGTNWFGKGICRMISSDPAFRYIRPAPYPEDKQENNVRSLFVDSEGYVWAGTKNGQIHIYDLQMKQVHIMNRHNTPGYTGSNVYSMIEDSEGCIWLGTKGGGILKTDQSIRSVFPDYGAFSLSRVGRASGEGGSLNNNNVYDMVQDRQGRVWVATYGGGLNLIEPAVNKGEWKFRYFNTGNSSITHDRLRDLCLDRSGRLWLATSYGLNYIDIYLDKELKIHNVLASRNDPASLSYNFLTMVIENRQGHVWLATAGGGLNEMLNSTEGKPEFRHYKAKDEGLSQDYLQSLAEDSYGYIWIGTSNGLTRLNPLNHLIENFDKKYGLPETFFSEQTSATTRDGRVLFGTINGFYAISPEKIVGASFTPSICLTGFKLYNREVTPGQERSPLQNSISFTREITLNANQSNFAIEFSLLSFRSPENNQYEYILEGFDQQWNYVGREHRAPYTNVPPGEYTFRVRGLSSSLSEFNTETSLHIIVRPPLWRTKTAYLFYFLIASGAFLLAFRIMGRMTRLKNNLKVEQRVAESKFRFFTNISHEFRTPLTLILGPVEQMISRRDLPPESRQQLAQVHRSSKRLLRMVNQLLDFRKVQNGKMNLQIRPIRVIPFLRQIYESYGELARQKEIKYDFIHEYDDMEIWGDIEKLDSVFFNLLSNAFKFTPRGGSITLLVEPEYEGGDCVKIRVRDTGAGIEKDQLNMIFNRFYVPHNQEKSEYQGTGIGLSLSQEYITLHRGEIRVESSPGKGTEFTVKLLVGIDHFPKEVMIREREAFSHTPNAELIGEDLTARTENTEPGNRIDMPIVLIVEDDHEMRRYLRGILASEYRVHEARDGLEGLRKAESLNPDLIITDILMPAMDGIEMTRKLKESFDTSHIPVIILSSKSAVESQVEGLETGAEVYLPKPFDAELLQSYARTLLAQREKLRELFESTIELEPDEVNVRPRDKIFMENVLQNIEKNLSNTEFTVEKLAGSVNVSRTLFYKKIKGITGYQPIELIRMLRLKKALKLIETGEFNISEVAYMVGYNDIRYFSTSFKKQFGLSPSRYRKTGIHH